MKTYILRLLREDQGQDLIEYALLAAAISTAAIAGMQALGSALDAKYTSLSSVIAGGS